MMFLAQPGHGIGAYVIVSESVSVVDETILAKYNLRRLRLAPGQDSSLLRWWPRREPNCGTPTGPHTLVCTCAPRGTCGVGLG